MKTINLEGKKVRMYRGYEMPNFSKWLLNKLNGMVRPENYWTYERKCDYDSINKLLGMYGYIIVLKKKPEDGKLILKCNSFNAYEISFQDTYFRKPYTAQAVVFVTNIKRP